MASKAAISQAIQTLIASGVANAPTTSERVALVVGLWNDALGDLSDADLKAAVMAHLRDPERCQFWPQPGTLLALAPSQSGRMSADEAWGWCVEVASRCGSYHLEAGLREIDDQDESAQLHAGLQAAGGLRHLGQCDNSEHGHMRASFRAAYNAATGRARIESSHQLTDGESRKLLSQLRPPVRTVR